MVNCPGCSPRAAEPYAAGLLAGLCNPSVVAVAVTRGACRVRPESTPVRVPSTTLCAPVSKEAELLPTNTVDAKAPFDSVLGVVIPAIAASARPPEANTLAVTIKPTNRSREWFRHIASCSRFHPGLEENQQPIAPNVIIEPNDQSASQQA